LQVSDAVQEAEEAILHGGGDTAATQKALLKERVPDFLRRLCSSASGGDEPLLLASSLVTLSATALPQVDRLRVPLPAYHHPASGDRDESEDEAATAYVRFLL
jgi:hypothetical protein